MKRLLSLILVTVMLISLLPAASAAELQNPSEVTVTYDMTPDVFTDRNTNLTSIDYTHTNDFWKYFAKTSGYTGNLKTDRNYGYLGLYSYGGQN